MSKKQSIAYEDGAARECKWCYEYQKDSIHRLLHEANCPAKKKKTNAEIEEERIAVSTKRYEEKKTKCEKKNMKKKKGSGILRIQRSRRVRFKASWMERSRV